MYADRTYRPTASTSPRRSIIQPALQIGQPDDRYEQEADAVADQVVTSPGTTPPALQRMALGQEEEEGGMMQMKPFGESPSLQMKCAACEAREQDEEVQRKPMAIQRKEGGMTASPEISQQLSSRAGRGATLPDALNEEMSRKIGADFSKVRVHTDLQAVQMSQDLGARAFTHGNDIYFNSGQYDPGSKTGKHLLAHELTHTVQQSGGIAPKMIQRQMILENPADPFDAIQQNRAVFEQWLQEMCPDIAWAVDGSTGVVSAPGEANFCASRPQRGHLHHTRASMPFSCGCLCEYIGPASRDVDVRITHQVTFGGTVVPLSRTGEGFTESPAMRGGGANPRVNVSGQEPEPRGAGDTSPQRGTGRAQVLRTPAWLVFGHELCGHVHHNHSIMTHQNTHTMNPNYDGDSGIDAANRLRREHSTQADNLGISLGRIHVGGRRLNGSMYVVKAGETISSIANRCGIPQADRTRMILRSNGDNLNHGGRTEHEISEGERLFIRNVYWHQVIQGDTMSSIAGAWDISLQELIHANQHHKNIHDIRPGQMFLIPNN